MKAEKLSNTELKIDFESLREYWFDKFAWSWPAIIGFYFLVASIFKMLIFFELFLQTFIVTLVLSIVGFYKISRTRIRIPTIQLGCDVFTRIRCHTGLCEGTYVDKYLGIFREPNGIRTKRKSFQRDDF